MAKSRKDTNPIEARLIAKVIMERNKDKDFVKRAYNVGAYPNSNMFTMNEPDEFGSKMSHKMAWGEDESGQAWMFPTVMNPGNEAIKIPNQYADYLSSEGYKEITNMNKNRKIPKYNTGGNFWKKAGEFGTNYAKFVGDTALSAAGLDNVIDNYEGAGSKFFEGSADIAGGMGKVALPIAANMIAPGSGQFVAAGQQVAGQFNPQDPSGEYRQTQAIGQGLGSMGAAGLNMAMMRNGGNIVQMDGPSHEQGGIQIQSPNGMYEVEKQEVIKTEPGQDRILSDRLKNPITGKTFAQTAETSARLNSMAEKMKKFNPKFAKKIEDKSNEIFDREYDIQENYVKPMEEQKKQDKYRSQLERDMYACGGMVKMKDGGIYIKPSNRGKFTAAAKRAGMDVQEYANHILANKEDFSSTLIKRANFAHNAAGWKHEDGGLVQYQIGGLMGGDDPKKKGAVKVTKVPSDYNLSRVEGNKTFYNKQADKAIVDPNNPNIKPSPNWEQSIINRLQSGVSPESLVEQGHISPSQIDKFRPYYKEIYTEKTSNMDTSPQPLSLNVTDRISRKRINSNMSGVTAYRYPHPNAGYNEATTRYFLASDENLEIDPNSVSYDDKGNLITNKLSYINTDKEGIKGTVKSDLGQNIGANDSLQEAVETFGHEERTGMGFRYGGLMKYTKGGKKYYTGPTDMREDEMPINYEQKVYDPVEYVGQSPFNENSVYLTNYNNSLIKGLDEFNTNNTNNTNDTNNNGPDWRNIATQAGIGLASNIGNIREILEANEAESTSFPLVNPAQLSPVAALNYNNVQGRKLAEDIREGSVGKSSTYLNARRDAAINQMRTNAQIREDFENRNALLRQQTGILNNKILQDQYIANEQNRARRRDKSLNAWDNIGENIMSQRRDQLMSNRDKDILNIIAQQYPDAMYNPALRKYYQKRV